MLHQVVQKVINEANKDYLNISIKNVDKVIKDEATAEALINQEVIVYGKYDGVKISILRNNEPWNPDHWYDMFIVSYKGNIIYGNEFKDVTDYDTIGESQYKVITDHVARNYKDWECIPMNTEFFLEFLMNKPTLTRKYTSLRHLILIGKANVYGYTSNFGKIQTSTSTLTMDGREEDAELLKVNVPELMFRGKLKNLLTGLTKRVTHFYEVAENGTPLEYWEVTKQYFLDIPSLYGAPKEEGVVIHLTEPIGNANVLKIVQQDQYNKELRASIRQKYKMEPLDEDAYWVNVRKASIQLVEFLKDIETLPKALGHLSELVYNNIELNFTHAKKDERNIRDDIQHVTKSILIKQMAGNDGALVVMKSRVFTNGHKKMFDQALSNHDFLVVTIVSNKETKATLDLRKAMILANYPGVEIIETTSGNLFTMINKTTSNINAVYAGSDRVEGYREQLKRTLDIEVFEVTRTDEDESASKVIDNIKNYDYLIANTPEPTWQFYEDLLKIYVRNPEHIKEIMLAIN